MPARRRVPHRRSRLGIAAGSTRTTPPRCRALGGGPIRAVFPTTTPVGLGSFGTGLLPGAHGLVGAAFEYPETGELLSPLQWGAHPPPVAVQPEPTVFERVARSGVDDDDGVAGRLPRLRAHASRAAGGRLRSGRRRRPADRRGRAVPAPAPSASFTYVYWPELDRVGHEFGVASREWRLALQRADALVARLAAALVPGQHAGGHRRPRHGRLPRRRCASTSRPRAAARRRACGASRGEPRARQLYVTPGAAARRAGAPGGTCSATGPGAAPATRPSTAAGSAPVDAASSRPRIGDVMARAARQRRCSPAASTRPCSQLLGLHGALSDDEVLIPALVHACPDVWHDVRVAELVFFSGTMDCGKSTLALQMDHNHAARGRAGRDLHQARPGRASRCSPAASGLRSPAVEVDDDLDFWARTSSSGSPAGARVDYLICDEAQFYTRGPGRAARPDRRRARHRRLRVRHHHRLPHPAVPGLGPADRARRPGAGAAGRGAVLVRRAGHPQRPHRQRRDGRRGQQVVVGDTTSEATDHVAYEVLCRTHYRSRMTAARRSASTCRRSRCRSGRSHTRSEP